MKQLDFMRLISRKRMEDPVAIQSVETFLIKKRDYVFRMPAPGNEVILLVSGGLDSIVIWQMLMEDYGLVVYPLTLHRGLDKSSRERKALKDFCVYFKKRYPAVYKEPFDLDVRLPQLAISQAKLYKMLHDEVILEAIGDEGIFDVNLSLGSSALSPILARMYGRYLYLTEHKVLRTIFCGVTASDGYPVPEQTFTALRLGMQYLCITTQEYDWQFASPALEKELGMYLTKADLVRWGAEHDLPMEKTWSCYTNQRYHCGDMCLTCVARRGAFAEAGVPDKTSYMKSKKIY